MIDVRNPTKHGLASSQAATEPSGDATFAVADSSGLQLHRGRNLFQLFALSAFAALGAVVGSSLTDDHPDLAALAGGILGMIVGAFLSGFVLMLLPAPIAPAVMMTLSQIRRKYHRLKKRLITGAIFL